jgi:hypothetical protein
VVPPIAAFISVLIAIYCVLKRRASALAFAKATAPCGLNYQCPQLLKAGTPVQDLQPEFAHAGSPAANAFAVIEGQLPAGLRMSKLTGVISGVPSVAKSALFESVFRVEARNMKGATNCVIVLKVETRAAPADLIYTVDSDLVVGVHVSLMPTLKPGIPYTRFRAQAFAMPRGLELDPATGIISGTAQDAMPSFSLAIIAFNDHGDVSCELSLSILDQIAPSGLQYADLFEWSVLRVGDACVFKPVFDLGRPKATFKITPGLPEGIVMDLMSGVIAGTPSRPEPRKAFKVSLQNQKGKCEFIFSVEVQLHIPPRSLSYAAFDGLQGTPHQIFVCDELFRPAFPLIDQGTHLTFQVDPPLPPGLEIHQSKGIITGKPTATAIKTEYTVTVLNHKGSAQTLITFATCMDYIKTAPNEWSTDQVQLWAQRGLNLEVKDREALLAVNGQMLLSMRSLEALKRELPALQGPIQRLLLLEIENIYRTQLKEGRDDVQILRPAPDAQRGDPASKNMLPLELRGDYEPVCIVGNGGYGTVIKAGKVLKGHVQYHVAIKVFYSDRPFPENDVKRMNREASLLGRIDSPHVVKLKGSGISGSACAYWLIMDFLDGKNLQELIAEQKPFSEDQVCDMARQLLLGLQATHQIGAAHCDVKPANVMQCAGPEAASMYRLVDLGVAVAIADASASLATLGARDRGMRGTPGYMCPELIRNEAGSPGIGPQTDIWSLGATLFEVLSGRLPFCTTIPPSKPTPWDLMAVARDLDEEPPDVAGLSRLPVSPGLSSIVKTALWKRPEGRYASAEAMMAALVAHSSDRRQLPPGWAPGAMERVALDPGTDEYREVAGRFEQSAGGGFLVVRVERVQNLGQWMLYQARKRAMAARGGRGHDERLLFHGTDEATVPKIVAAAFNRSYCGKNATVYGQGVYFAREARYSASDTYSRPDARGEKRMFLCRLLVGTYARGDSGMRVPSARADGDGLCDTTVDDPRAPSVFVAYHDAQVCAC